LFGRTVVDVGPLVGKAVTIVTSTARKWNWLHLR
jgi:hypothetical protein